MIASSCCTKTHTSDVYHGDRHTIIHIDLIDIGPHLWWMYRCTPAKNENKNFRDQSTVVVTVSVISNKTFT